MERPFFMIQFTKESDKKGIDSMMKRLKYVLCISILIVTCIAVLLFFNIFTTDADKAITFIDFETYAIKNEDGALTPITMEEFYAITPENDQTFVFTTTIQDENYDDYIQLTPTGMEIRVWFGDTQVYHSDSFLPDNIIDQITSRIPVRGMELPLTVTMECRHLGGVNTIFPPMLFTTSDMTEMLPNLSWAHRGGISTGAFAVIFILLVGLFLYSIIEEKPRYSLLTLILASAILTIRCICTESGYLFLPDWMVTAFARDELLWLLFAAFIIYFVANRKRFRLFGWCSLVSGIIFTGTFCLSLTTGGYFALTVKEFVNSLILYGDYIRPLIWLNYWLLFVCLIVASITTIHSISSHMAKEQSLQLKAQFAVENYRTIEEHSKQIQNQHHEFKNHVSALKLMLEQTKITDAKSYLSELEQRNRTTIKFTGNYVINAILQHASSRALELGFPLEAYARVEEQLNIPETDLCSLLFNMLDNAFEAVSKIDDPKKRQIEIRIKQKDYSLGIYCANTYALAPVFEAENRLRSHKENPGHGFGITQMEQIAKKYQSKLDISYSEDIFIVQTVLFLPHNKDTKK